METDVDNIDTDVLEVEAANDEVRATKGVSS